MLENSEQLIVWAWWNSSQYTKEFRI